MAYFNYGKYSGKEDERKNSEKKTGYFNYSKYTPVQTVERREEPKIELPSQTPGKKTATNPIIAPKKSTIGPVQTVLPNSGTLLKQTQDRLNSFQGPPKSAMETKLPGRDLPNASTLFGIGNLLKGLDKIAEATKPASEIAQKLYVPGAGLTNIGSFAGAVESGLARVAPKLVSSSRLLPTIGREAIKETATGIPVGAGATLANNPNATPKQVAEGAAYGGALGAAGGTVLPVLGRIASPIIQSSLQKLMGRRSQVTPELENTVTTALNNAQPAKKLGVAYGKLTPASNESYINKVMGDIKPIVTERMTPPLENPNELAKWLQPHLGDDVSLNEIRKLPYEDMRQLAEEVRGNLSVYDLAKTAAKQRGYDLDQLLNNQTPSLKQAADRLRMGGIAGAIEPPKGPVRIATSRDIAVSPKTEPPKLNSIDEPALTEEPDVIQASPEPRIRDRVYSRLDEMEKAARKRLDAKKGRLSANPLGEWLDHGIIMAAKTGKGTIKAANFTEELVKEFGESIRPHAAAILRQTREILRTQERLASNEGKAAAEFNAGDGDANTFMQKISKNAPKKKRSLSEITQKARTQFSDDFTALEGLEKNVRGRLSSAEDSLYKSARNFRGLPAKSLQIVQERLTPIAQSVEKTGHSMDELGAYALAKHSEDVNAAGYKSGFTDKEIADIINKYGTPEMEAIRKDLVKVNDDMLQQLVDGGVVSKELASTLRDRWPNYIPLFRQLEDESVGFEGGLSKALANVASPIKALKGSEKKVIDPMENMVKNIFQSTSAAERNKVAQQLAKLAEDDVDETFIRKLGPDEEVGRKNVVNVKVNGENVKYEVQPEVYKALLNMDQESSNMLIKALQAPASLLRSGATLTPEFSLRNPMRDVVQAFIVSESGFNPIVDFPVGLIQTIKKGPLYKEWVDNMGDFGNTVSMDRNAHKEALRKVLGDTKSKKFVNIVTGRSLLRLLRAITDTTESATKVGEYRAALRKGATPQEAAYRARDIMDFGRAGTSIRQTNKVIAFLNANIQGKSKLIRAAKADPWGVGIRAFTAVTLPTVTAFVMKKYLANDTQKQTIDESPDWLKDSFWLIPVPGTSVVARIPKPFDLAPLFANLPEKALEFVYDKDKAAFDGFARRTIASYALPTQITGLLPFIEGMANYSFFRQGQIIPQREEGLEFKDQYDPVRTTETAKGLSAVVNAVTGGKGPFKNFGSPRIMDNTISGLTAGLGSYATSAIDSLLQGKVPFTNFKAAPAIVNRPTAPAKRLEQQPLAKAFLVDPLQSTKSIDKLYTRKDQLSREKSSASLNEKKFDKLKSSELKGLEKMADKLSKINKNIRTIEADKTLTAKQKREQIEVLLKQRNDLVGSAKK